MSCDNETLCKQRYKQFGGTSLTELFVLGVNYPTVSSAWFAAPALQDVWDR